MVRVSKWRRWLAMALGVLVLVAVAGGPSLESLLCRDDAGLWAAAQAVDAVALGSIDEGLAPCVHGDCHHVAPYTPEPPAMIGAPLPAAAELPRPERRRVAAGDLQFGLMRPPRG